jgi:tellurite resistance protein TerC
MQEISLWGWIAFAVLVSVLLAIDLFAHRGERGGSLRSAYIWSCIWIAAGLLFAIFVWLVFGAARAHEYLAAYLIEKSLSLDNLFVFLIVFNNLAIPKEYQHNVLYWGIFGALVFRAVFIYLGIAAMERFAWVSYVFAAVLLLAAWHSFRQDLAAQETNKVVKWLSRHLPVSREIHGARFLVRQNGRLLATPLLIALLGLELTDIVFAIDSVPAALAVSRNRFVVYSSNVFAILGLRAIYSALAFALTELRYLHYGLAGVLAFAGIKIIIDEWVTIHPLAAVGITVLLIGGAVWASLRGIKGSGDER